MKKTFLSKILLLVILFTMFSSQFLQSSHVSAHTNNSYLSYSIVDVNFISANNGDENSWWDSITSWFESVGDDFQETGDKIKEKFESIINSISSLFNSIDDGVKTFSSSESNEEEKAKEINRSVDEVTEEIRKNLKDDEKDGNKGTGNGDSKNKLTEPSLPKGGKPKGNYGVGDSHGIKKQNETADFLADQGYDIEMLDEIEGGNGYGIKPNSNPDFLIEGKVFDCYAPTVNTNVNNIIRNIRTKTKTQAERIILNLDDFDSNKVTEITEGILRKANLNGDLKSLIELIIVKDGKITRVVGG